MLRKVSLLSLITFAFAGTVSGSDCFVFVAREDVCSEIQPEDLKICFSSCVKWTAQSDYECVHNPEMEYEINGEDVDQQIDYYDFAQEFENGHQQGLTKYYDCRDIGECDCDFPQGGIPLCVYGEDTAPDAAAVTINPFSPCVGE